MFIVRFVTVVFEDYFPLALFLLIYGMGSMAIGVGTAFEEGNCKFNRVFTYYNPITHSTCYVFVKRDDLGK
jgi:uncharacterized membrane protein